MSTATGVARIESSTAESNARQAWGIALVRGIVGVVFLVHGGQKLFVFGVHNVAGMMGNLGIPLPGVAATVVTLVEFLGGAALLFGLFTRAAALLLAIDMFMAVLKVHLKNGFFLPMGFEYALTLLVMNLALFIGGSGALAVDNKLGKRG
jgi:putative oxidoreductase